MANHSIKKALIVKIYALTKIKNDNIGVESILLDNYSAPIRQGKLRCTWDISFGHHLEAHASLHVKDCFKWLCPDLLILKINQNII